MLKQNSSGGTFSKILAFVIALSVVTSTGLVYFPDLKAKAVTKTDTTVSFNFDGTQGAQDLSDYFASYYSSDLTSSEFVTPSDSMWTLTDGHLYRKPVSTTVPQYSLQNMAALYYKAQKFQNCEIDVTYGWDPNYRFAVGFGAKELGATPSLTVNPLDANQTSKGGTVVWVEGEGGRYYYGDETNGGLWGGANSVGEAYTSGGIASDVKNGYTQSGTHKLRIVIVGTSVKTYIDNYTSYFEATLPENHNGYISLMCNEPNPQSDQYFDDFSITALDASGNPTSLGPKAVSIEQMNNQLAVTKGTSVADVTSKLPATLQVTDSLGGTENCPVAWTCAGYNGNVGTYNFVGTPTLPDTMSNANAVYSTATVNVYDPQTTVLYDFDNSNTNIGLSDFKDYYSTDLTSKEFDGTGRTPSSDWNITNGHLYRNVSTSNPAQYSFSNMAALYYSPRKFDNCEIDVTYGWDSNFRFAVGFGAAATGKSPSLSVNPLNASTGTGVGGAMVWVEGEGGRYYYGDQTTGDLYNNAKSYGEAYTPGGIASDVKGGYTQSGTHKLRIVIVGKNVKTYIDNYPSYFETTLPTNHDGYISLLCNEPNPNSSQYFDNFSITALDSTGNPTNIHVNNATSIESVSNTVNVTKGTALSQVLQKLPSTLKVTDNTNSTRDCAVTWTCTGYNGNVGTYTVTGTPTMPNDLTNSNNLTASATVRVYDPDTTVNVDFSDSAQLSDFTNYFSTDLTTTEYTSPALSTDWSVENGHLTRNAVSSNPAAWQLQNMAALYYNKHKFQNCEIDVTYGWDYNFRFAVGFGAKALGKSPSLTVNPVDANGVGAGGAIVWAEGEGGRYYYGDITNGGFYQNANSLGEQYTSNGTAADVKNGYIQSGIHRMRIVIIGKTVKTYIDGFASNFEATLPENHDGYISLLCNEPNPESNQYFDDFSVTALDANGNPISLDTSNITSIAPVDDVTTVTGQSVTQISSKLPATVKVTDSNGTQTDCNVRWSCEGYDGTAGTYVFTGTPILPDGLLNSYKILASCTVNVYNPTTTVFYDFSNKSQLNDFTSYRADDLNSGDPLQTAAASSLWQVKDGHLWRVPFTPAPAAYALTNMAALYFSKQKFKNCEIKVTYGRNQNYRFAVGFGATQMGQPIMLTSANGNPDGGVVTWVEGEGGRFLQGSLQGGTVAREANQPLPADVATEYPQSPLHTLKVDIIGRTAKVSIDNDTTSYDQNLVLTPSSTGYYVSLLCNNNTQDAYQYFDNFSITALDVNGNPVALNQTAGENGTSNDVNDGTNDQMNNDTNNGDYQGSGGYGTVLPGDTQSNGSAENAVDTGDSFPILLLIVSIVISGAGVFGIRALGVRSEKESGKRTA